MEDGWIEWHGGVCPVTQGTKVAYETGDYGLSEDQAERLYWSWKCNGRGGDIISYKVIAESAEEHAPTVSDGGSSDYYKLTIKNKAGEEIQCEMGDIIRCVYGDDFNLGNIAKAARRMYLASKGIGKEGTSVTYDANKIEYFAREFEFWHTEV